MGLVPRWFRSLVLVLAMAPAVAWAGPSDDTARAQAAMTGAARKVTALTGQRAPLVQKFQSETDAVDRLKKEKASWRRDRELRAELADTADTANQLAALDRQLAAAQGELAGARKALATAVDAEIAAGASAERAAQLAKLRAQLGTGGRAPKKIVIPDAEIDPLADPEDLDKQAADLRQAEQELAGEVKGLDKQATELADVADLRKHHERAIDMSRRDDDQPLRTQQRAESTTAGVNTPTGGGAGGGASSPPPGAGGGSGSGGGTGGGQDSFGGSDRTPTASTAFESEASIVLGDVLDHATIDGLARASRSGDPAQRAEAAKKARDAVRARLDQLAKKRAAIEARARQLRGGR
jgi:hypothetical protein